MGSQASTIMAIPITGTLIVSLTTTIIISRSIGSIIGVIIIAIMISIIIVYLGSQACSSAAGPTSSRRLRAASAARAARR